MHSAFYAIVGRVIIFGCFIAPVFIFMVSSGTAQEKAVPSHHPLWITAYYAFWEQDNLKPDEIDMSALTHLVHFALVPRPDGSFQPDGNTLNEDKPKAAVAATHRAGRKILISVGGGGTIEGFREAININNRSNFVRNIVDWTGEHGYDGVDVDMEPIEERDVGNFKAFIHDLHGKLKARNPAFILTTAAGDDPRVFGALQRYFDQINVMTYNLSGPWSGWPTWHNASLYDGGHRFPGGGGPLPSCDSIVRKWLAAGLPARKLVLCHNLIFG